MSTATTYPTPVTAWRAHDGTLCASPEQALLRDAADTWHEARRTLDKADDKLRNFTRASEIGDTVDMEALRDAAIQVLSAARFVNETREALDIARKNAGVKP